MNTLPQVLDERREDGLVRLLLALPAGLAAFEGHFPEHPILPGVVQLAWATGLARERFAALPEFSQLAGVKFQRVIGPGDDVSLELGYDAASGELRFRYYRGEDTCSSGRLRARRDA